jgi:predicted ArsR family transcriptional regulator
MKYLSKSGLRRQTSKEQQNNRKPCVRVIYKSKTFTISELARELGITYMSLWHLINLKKINVVTYKLGENNNVQL